MAQYSYISLLQAIEQFADSHLQIKKFGSDFPAEIPNLATIDEAYPVLFISPTNSIYDVNTTSIVFNAYCYDVIQKDRSNITTILSDTSLILNDLKVWLTDGNLPGIDVIQTSTATPINNGLLDYAAGWVATFQVEMDQYGICDIPFSATPIVTGVCNSITYGSALTCETLADCPTIIEIQNDIATLSGRTDVYVTGGTYSAGTAVFTNNSGDTFSVSGFSTGSTSGSGSELKETITAGENLIQNDLVYLSTDGKYYKADNTIESKSSTTLRVAMSTILANASGDGLMYGSVITTGLTAGANYYVGTNGGYTTLIPSANGTFMRIIGTAKDTTTLEFNPDENWYEIQSGSGGGVTQPMIRNVSTSQNILTNDYTLNVTGGTPTLTLPNATPIQGKIYNVKLKAPTSVIINTTSSQTIDDSTSITITIQYHSLTFQSDGSGWIII